MKETGTGEDAFWDKVHAIEKAFQDGLEKNVPEDATSALLDLDGTIWTAQQELENAEFISQARDILRDMLALLGTSFSSSPKSEAECLAPIVEQLLDLREFFRQQKKWQEADAIRECLAQANIVIEDTKGGVTLAAEKLISLCSCHPVHISLSFDTGSFGRFPVN